MSRVDSSISPRATGRAENSTSASNAFHRDFHGAALIDANGTEQKITEEMVQTAIKALDPEA